MKIILLLSVLTMAALLVTAGCSTTRAGYKTAPYTLARTAGSFEVRDYPTMMVVETSMTGSGGDAGFGRLFRFISGRNEKAQKIAMTTPVLMSGDESNRTMAFVLPENLESSRIPQPADTSVTVREIPQGRFAVLRFSGGRSAKSEEAALDRLKTWMAAEGLSTSSPPVYGYFDPPWTPSFWRRNEVMLRIEARTK
jgi:effector-binding domain-containing protein